VSYDRLDPEETIDAFAIRALGCAGWFAPNQPIQRDLLDTAVAAVCIGASPARLDRAVQRLAELGLVTLGVDGVAQVHRLVHAFSRERIADPSAGAAVQQAIYTAALNCGNDLMSLRRLAVQLRAVTNSALERDDAAGADLCCVFGWYLTLCGAYGEAQRYQERGLAIRERLLGLGHLLVGDSLFRLGLVHHYTANYSQARSYYEHSLAIYERHGAAAEQARWTLLDNFGFLLMNQGEYMAAERLLRLSLRGVGACKARVTRIRRALCAAWGYSPSGRAHTSRRGGTARWRCGSSSVTSAIRRLLPRRLSTTWGSSVISRGHTSWRWATISAPWRCARPSMEPRMTRRQFCTTISRRAC
jgi:hypothetical protein